LAIIMGFYVVGLVLLLMVMQILALGFPNRWYLKLFWFEGTATAVATARSLFTVPAGAFDAAMGDRHDDDYDGADGGGASV
jgi:hypothetical protein